MTPDARDRMLVRLAQTGDQRAEDRLVRLHTGLAYGLAREYYYPGADYEDVRQEALLGLAKACRSFDPRSETLFRTFARLCITRQVITGLKAAQRAKHAPLNLSARVGWNEEGQEIQIVDLLPSPYGRDPFVVVCAKERIEALIQRMSTLSARERVSLLGIANGDTYEQIGRTTGWSFKVIDNAAQRARTKLADLKEAA